MVLEVSIPSALPSAWTNKNTFGSSLAAVAELQLIEPMLLRSESKMQATAGTSASCSSNFQTDDRSCSEAETKQQFKLTMQVMEIA